MRRLVKTLSLFVLAILLVETSMIAKDNAALSSDPFASKLRPAPEIVCVTPGSTPPIPDGHYFVIPDSNRQFCLDKDSGSDEDLKTNFCNGSIYQIFHFGRRDANGCYMIHAIGSGQGIQARYLTIQPHLYVSFETWRNRQIIVLPPGQNTDRWGVFPSVNGRFTIHRAADNTCLDRRTQGGWAQAIDCRGVAAQNWTLQPYSAKQMRDRLKTLQDEQRATNERLKAKKNNKTRLHNKMNSLQREIDLLNAALVEACTCDS